MSNTLSSYVKESATAYTMEVAAPGLKKDMVKMNIDKDGYLNVSIENKDENQYRHTVPCGHPRPA